MASRLGGSKYAAARTVFGDRGHAAQKKSAAEPRRFVLVSIPLRRQCEAPDGAGAAGAGVEAAGLGFEAGAEVAGPGAAGAEVVAGLATERPS